MHEVEPYPIDDFGQQEAQIRRCQPMRSFKMILQFDNGKVTKASLEKKKEYHIVITSKSYVYQLSLCILVTVFFPQFFKTYFKTNSALNFIACIVKHFAFFKWGTKGINQYIFITMQTYYDTISFWGERRGKRIGNYEKSQKSIIIGHSNACLI